VRVAGRFPARVTSLSSVLLFNSNVNPYRDYTSFDPFGVEGKTRDQEIEKQKVLLVFPPSYIHVVYANNDKSREAEAEAEEKTKITITNNDSDNDSDNDKDRDKDKDKD
jgi:hypothetical protein